MCVLDFLFDAVSALKCAKFSVSGGRTETHGLEGKQNLLPDLDNAARNTKVPHVTWDVKVALYCLKFTVR